MPPRQDSALGPVSMPKPSFQPPAVERAPASLESSASQSYTVQSGDSLSKIAAKVGVTSREIAELNNIKDANKIKLGQKLVLPSYASSVPVSTPASSTSAAKPVVKKAAAKSVPSAPAVGGGGEYVVKSGDSLSKVAVKNGTTVKALREVNKLKSDMIRIGQKLQLPGASTKAATPAVVPVAAPVAPAPAIVPGVGSAVPAPAPAAVEASASAVAPIPDAASLAPAEVPFEYTVKPGDTLEDVAKTFAVTSQQILDANGLTAYEVTTGKKIKIPMPSP
jgi:LysM repeat protein